MYIEMTTEKFHLAFSKFRQSKLLERTSDTYIRWIQL